MSKKLLAGSFVLLALLALALFGASTEPFSPGRQTLVLAHNSYPVDNKWADRLDRAISSGMPLAVEIDLCWGTDPKTGKNGSFVTHSPKAITGIEPTLKSYFFEHVRPIVEKALKANDKKNWPLIMVYLDIKNDPPEHLDFLSKQMGEYENWLTTAVKTKSAAQQSPLDVKPLIVLLEDKDNDVKEEYFYGRLPIGGKLRAFGSAKLTLPPGEGLTKRQILQARDKMRPEELVTERASDYRRWWGNLWEMVEPGPANAVGQWTPEKEARLNSIVRHAHKMGYLVSLTCLNGYEPGKGQGWQEEYNFGSLQAATIRWKAALKAGADFIASDQYEELAKAIKSRK